MKSIYLNTLTHKCTAWLLLAVLCVGAIGCKKELEPIVAKDEPAPAYISLSTKALGLGDSQINTVRVVLINPNANHTVALNEFVSSPAIPLIIPVQTGTYDVYVVANEEANNSEYAALSNVHNLSTLRAVGLPFFYSNRNLTNISMIGEVKNVTITAPVLGDSSPTNLANVSIGAINYGTTLPVEMDRMISKLSVKIISKYKSLRIAGITTSSEIPLFEDALPPFRLNQVGAVNPSLFTLTESTVDQAKHILEYKDILIPSRMFAPATDISNALTFDFTPHSVDRFVIKLGHTLSGATKDYTIKRNHNYEITITIIEKKLFTVVTLKPWNLVDDNVEVL